MYMDKFYKDEGLPNHLSRWQHTVDDMLEGIETNMPIYIMIDQSFVRAGETQRRPGMHIDGYWMPELRAHGNGGHAPRPTHGPNPELPSHSFRIHGSGGTTWNDADYAAPEGIILASNVSAARAINGEYTCHIGDGGSVSHLRCYGAATEVMLRANRAYAGNVTMLHESLPVERDCNRTLVRLNVPGYSPTLH